MIHPWSFIAALLVAALLAVAGAENASAAYVSTDKCNRKAQRSVAVNKVVRVYVDSAGSYIACVRKTGKRSELFETDDIYASGRVVSTAGYFVAFHFTEYPGCKAACPPDVDVTNLLGVTDARTGTTRNLHDGTFWSVRLKASGSIAWLYGTAEGTALDAWTTSRSTLDTGDISGLRVEGANLVWTKAGEQFSAPFA